MTFNCLNSLCHSMVLINIFDNGTSNIFELVKYIRYNKNNEYKQAAVIMAANISPPKSAAIIKRVVQAF